MIAQRCRSCTEATSGTVVIAACTSARRIPGGTPSSRMLTHSFKSTQVRGKTMKPMPTASSESTHCQPVNQMIAAPVITATEPSMSDQTSR
ncbi:hypothetical protein D3C72_2037990 [compost metagenome]